MRLPSLLSVLLMSALLVALVQVPLTAVPSYESGIAVAALAALLLALVAVRRAQSRPLEPQLRWGLLVAAPTEQVLRETGLNLRLGLVLVTLPVPVLVSEALSTGCRAFIGLPAYALATLPAIVVGAAAGTLAGSLTRRPRRAWSILALLLLLSIAADAFEFLQGGRMFVHDLVLGPLTTSGVTGHDQGLGFPASAAWHRAWALLLSAALLAGAALIRCFRDAPPLAEGESDLGGGDGWRESRGSEPARARFLLQHDARSARRALAILAVLALPFLALHEHAGILGGRERLESAMPAVAETEHFRLHFAPGSAVEAHVQRLAVELEWAREQARQWTGIDPPWPVHAWLHPDAETMFQLTGARGFVFAVPWRHEFHVHAERGRIRALRHELLHVHVADRGLWPFRVSVSMGLTEGLATALDEGFARHVEAHEPVAAALAAGFLPPAGALMSWTGFSGGTPDQSYRASASFVGWLIREHGAGPVLDAYAWGNVDGVLGKPMDELDAAWRRFLADEVPVPPSSEARGRERFDPSKRPAFRKTPCSRLGREPDPEGRGRGDLLANERLHDAAADAYCETAGWREDPAILESAAWERVRAGRLPEALGLGHAALARLPERSTRREPLLRLLARVHAALGQPDEARALLDELRASGLAEHPDSVRLEEEGLLDPVLGPRYSQALLSPGPDATSRLGALVQEAPGFAPAIHELLLRLGTARPVTRDRLALGLRLAELAPGPLAGQRLLELARSREEELAWPDAATLYERALAMPGLRPQQAWEAEDGLGRARWAPGVRVRGVRLVRPPAPADAAAAPPPEPAERGAGLR